MLWRGHTRIEPDAGGLELASVFWSSGLLTEGLLDAASRHGRKSKEAPYFQWSAIIKEKFVHPLKINSPGNAVSALIKETRHPSCLWEGLSCIVRETGISRQRVSAWVGLVELPERNRMAPNPRTPAFYEEHLAQRWAEGFRHGRKLLKEIQALGYTGCFSYLARFLAGWRQKRSTTPLTSATTMPTAKVAPPAD